MIRGLRRYYDETLDQYELHIDGSLVATSDTLPITHTVALAEGEYVATTYKRSRYDLLSGGTNSTIRIDNEGNVLADRPTPARAVQLSNGADGSIVVSAFWLALGQESTITHWHIYSTTNNIDPDPAVDTPEAVAVVVSGGMVELRINTADSADATPWRVLVRTVRDGVESDNTDIYSIASIDDSPQMGQGSASFQHGSGIRIG